MKWNESQASTENINQFDCECALKQNATSKLDDFYATFGLYRKSWPIAHDNGTHTWHMHSAHMQRALGTVYLFAKYKTNKQNPHFQCMTNWMDHLIKMSTKPHSPSKTHCIQSLHWTVYETTIQLICICLLLANVSDLLVNVILNALEKSAN